MVILVEDRRKVFLLKLKKECIKNDGRYVDVTVPLMFDLTNEDIAFLRKVYSENIAKDVRLQSSNLKKKNYNLTREQKYTRCHMKNRIKKKGFIPCIIGGTVILVSIGLMASVFETKAGTLENETYYEEQVVEKQDTLDSLKEQDDAIFIDDYSILGEMKNNKKDVLEDYYILDDGEVSEDVSEEVKEEDSITQEEIVDDVSVTQEDLEEENVLSQREEWVKKYTDIYGLDYDLVYANLQRLTNDFTSEDYLNNFHINGVTCKGSDVYADSEEQLILLYVRCCKQLPSQVGLSSKEIVKDTGYDSGTSYASMIDWISKVVGVDRNIYYAMVQAETGFNSELFLNSYNPIGIRTNGEWWSFSSAAEGLIEGALELAKYNDMGAYEISDIALIHDPNEASYWTGLVEDIYYNMVLPNEGEIFGDATTLDGQVKK